MAFVCLFLHYILIRHVLNFFDVLLILLKCSKYLLHPNLIVHDWHFDIDLYCLILCKCLLFLGDCCFVRFGLALRVGFFIRGWLLSSFSRLLLSDFNQLLDTSIVLYSRQANHRHLASLHSLRVDTDLSWQPSHHNC